MPGTVRACGAVFAGLLCASSAFAQSAAQPPQCAPFEAIAANLLRGARDQSDLPALQGLRALTPASCFGTRNSLQDAISAATQRPEWRIADAAGAIAPAEPPRFAGATFRPQLDGEMLTARPSMPDIMSLYPIRARERARSGLVVLEGRARADGSFVWRVLHEWPSGWGFGDAAVRAGAYFRAPSTFRDDGRSVEGAEFQTTISFRMM